MEKLNKKEKIHLFLIILIYLGIALIITHGEYVFGSKIDWGYQHFAFPEYFRMLFYETHDLFPDFALNIGGGQNIFYFAYYGLFSPIVLFSYLLPFVPMSFYLSFVMLLFGVWSIYLFYKWIKGFSFSNKLCFILTLMFAMAGPLLFHSHRHVMFVSYMPFLLLGLIGVRRYFYKGYKGLLVISVFLMILTSYYYSVGGIFCLTLYGIYEYLKINDKFVFKDFVKKGVCYALLIILGIMMAGILLFPVIYTLMNGRADSLSDVTLIDALIPNINLQFLLYDGYSLGLTSISFLAIIYLIFKNKESRFLGICLSLMIICPIFVYILNGALYLDGKALIPFLPLYVFAIGLFLRDVLENKVNLKIILITMIISIILVFLTDNEWKLCFSLECFLYVIIWLLYKKFNKDLIIFVFLGFTCVFVCLNVNLNDNLISTEEFGRQNSLVIEDIMKDIASSDDGVYRTAIDLEVSNELVNHVSYINQNLITLYSSTYNTLYSELFYNFNNNRASRNMFITSEKGNILFESYMGVKYLITDKDDVALGYKLWKEYGEYKVYINESALPLGFATNRVIDKSDYEDYSFPLDSLALLGNVVTDGGNFVYESLAKEEKFSLDDSVQKNLKIEDYKDGYKVTVNNEDGGTLKVKLNGLKENIYLLRFTLENPQKCSLGDTSITVNGIINKLTCRSWKYFNSNYTFDYTISNDVDYLNIEFSKGVHYIKKIELYSVNYDELINYMDTDALDVSFASGDIIKGVINVSNDGYFNLSIPYDKGFTIKVDGEKIEYEKVNEAFIGFPIEKGKHNIEIEFKAPYALFGKVVSLIGFFMFIFMLIFEFRKSKIKKLA